MPNVSHFEILGVKPDASAEDIKKAYKKLIFIYHPDKIEAWLTTAADKADAVEVFKRVDVANKTLIDPDKRRAYEATFQPLPSSINEELFRDKWERLHQQFSVYEQRTISPANYIIFLESQISQLQIRQNETSQQLNLLGRHFSQFNKFLQAESTKTTEQAETNRALQASLASSLEENARLKRQIEQSQATIKPIQTTLSSASQSGTFAVKPTDKLMPDGLKAVLKMTQESLNKDDSTLEWYWVNLEFFNEEKAAAFKKKFQTVVKNDWSINILFSSIRNCDLSVKLTNSPAYYETLECKEKTGMMIMRELARYINIENTQHHFVRGNNEIIPDNELSVEFKNRFLKFDLREDVNKRQRPS